jgi:hypothetical protein
VPSMVLSMSSMLLCSAGCGDAASAMVQARECGEHRIWLPGSTQSTQEKHPEWISTSMSMLGTRA